MRAGVDSNILLYADNSVDVDKAKAAQSILTTRGKDIVIPLQCVGEVYRVLLRKVKLPPQACLDSAKTWAEGYALALSTWPSMKRAMELSVAHQVHIWDAALLTSCLESDCRIFLSEDLQRGFSWSGITVVNPFASPRHPLRDEFLTQSD